MMKVRFAALLLVFLAAPSFAQTCALPPSGEAFCVARAGLSGKDAGDFVFAGRVNGLVKCVTVQFLNYYDGDGGWPNGSHFWFGSGAVLDRSDFVPQRKFTFYVQSVNTWTTTKFYVHRNTCNASPTFITQRGLNPSPKGAVDTPSNFQPETGSITNSP